MIRSRSRSSFLAAVGLTATALVVPQAVSASLAKTWNLTDAEWRKRLSPQAYGVLRHEDTEAPGSSALLDEHREGTFVCAGCALALFDSRTKFESHTGWPSFYEPLPHAVSTKSDSALLMERTEVHCARCSGHLGHVFNDGPKPTGLRYCMNGVAMAFVAKAAKKQG